MLNKDEGTTHKPSTKIKLAFIYYNCRNLVRDEIPALSVVLFDDAVDASCFGIA